MLFPKKYAEQQLYSGEARALGRLGGSGARVVGPKFGGLGRRVETLVGEAPAHTGQGIRGGGVGALCLNS